LKLWDEIDEVITTIYQCAATFLNQWQWENLKHFGKVKFNIDAAFLDGKVGIGVCLRDHDGCFVKAKTLCIVAHLTVKEGEAFGLL
jgi:hypothetical protein